MGGVSDLESMIRKIVRDEIRRARVANANHSGQPSPIGIAASGESNIPCDEATNRGSMDHISTEDSGDSMSLQQAEEDGRRLIEAIQRGTLPKPHSQARGRKRKALP